MRTVGNAGVLDGLLSRFRALTPEAQRRWGSLTAHEMLCHLGDAAAMVLGTRPRKEPLPPRRRPLIKALGLWLPIPWPHGWATNPAHNPKAEGTRPSDFEADRQRAMDGVRGIAAARPGELTPVHGFFGTMSVADWQRWAYRHSHHHLRQFGQ